MYWGSYIKIAMEQDALVRAAPMLEGELLTRRQDIKRTIVRFILSTDGFPEEFSIMRIQRTLDSELNVELDETSISDALGELENEGVVRHTYEREYELIEKPAVPTVEKLTSPLWNEFLEILKEKDNEIDPYINKDLERAFKDFFLRFFKGLAKASQELSEFNTEDFFDHEFNYIIDETVETRKLTEGETFKDALIEYLNNPTERLIDFTKIVYTGIVHLDLISREEDEVIDLRDVEDENKILILDTNVLISLFCETDSTHPIVSTACERAKELGYDLYYIEKTIDEMEYTIESAIEELSELDPDREADGLTDSQFAEYYFESDMNFPEFVADLEDWQSILKTEHGVREFDREIELVDNVLGFAKRSLEALFRQSSDYVSERKVNHDTALIAYAASMRSKSSSELNTGPFVLSRHNEVNKVSRMGEDLFWEEAIALHPQTWLNYLIAFSPAEISSDDYDDIAVALLRGAANTSEEISIDKYSDLLVPKTGLEPGDQELLTDYLKQHPLSEDIKDAIKYGRADIAEGLTKEALEGDDYSGKFEKEKELKEQKEKLEARIDEVTDRVRNQHDRLEELQNELEKEREKKEIALEVAKKQGNIELDIDAKANAEAYVVNEQQLVQEIDGFIEVLDASLPTGIDESELPNPPSDTSNLDQVREWLKKLNQTITNVEGLSSSAMFLQSKIPVLVQEIDRFAHLQ